MTSSPKKIAVTGAAGQINYSLLFRLASGSLLGPDQPIQLQLLEIPQALAAVQGVIMELEDCAFPLLHTISVTDAAATAFADIDYAFLVGATPRGPGIERNDLLQANAKIFVGQGKALNSTAKSSAKILVIGNPANTNALIAQHHAPKLDPANFSAMTRLDHNRTLSQLATQQGCNITEVINPIIWGNHSSTQFPDIHHCTIQGRPALESIDENWYRNTMVGAVQTRGAAVIAARGASSAASAAAAAIDHMRTWVFGTDEQQWTSMAVKGNGAYGVDDDLFYSYPVHCSNSQWSIATGLAISDWSRAQMKISEQELIEERDALRNIL